MNVGGTERYLSPAGVEYLPDQAWQAGGGYGFVGGAPDRRQLPAPVAGAVEQEYFDIQRLGWQEYHVASLAPGRYIVVLSFAERQAQGPHQSVFSVAVEGETVLPALDLFASAGLDRAYERAFLVQVDDSELTLQAQAIVGQTQLAALSLYAAEAAPAPPATPSGLSVTPSFNAAILTWAAPA